MRIALSVLLIMLASHSMADTVRIHILSKYHPQKITVTSEQGLSKTISIDDDLPVDFHEAEKYTVNVINSNVKRQYAGLLTIRRLGDELQIVNTVPLEDYVTSVVLSELGWHAEEAMRAQAVIARTWAITHRQANQYYDFDDLTNSQVYKGLFRQSAETSEIVQETLGEILEYNNDPIKVVYHANCGDRVYAAQTIWGGENTPYLANVDIPELTKGTINNNWTRVMTLNHLQTVFSNINTMTDHFYIRQKNKHQRLGVMVNDVWLGIDEFRLRVNRQLGWNTIASNEFSIQQYDQDWLLKGKGLGHLVGLCQRQAIALADKGWQYAEILQLFYPGTKLRQLMTSDKDYFNRP